MIAMEANFEWAWLTLSLIATGLVFRMWMVAQSGLNVVDATGQNGRTRMIASQHIATATFRLVKCVVSAMAALSAIVDAPGVIRVFGWIVLALLFIAESVMEEATQRRIMRYSTTGAHTHRRAGDVDLHRPR